MIKSYVFLLVFLIFYGCSIKPPDNEEYIPFECTAIAENRLYYPEESITFLFNMDINSLTVEGFKAISKSTSEKLSVDISGSSITIGPPLPADETIAISISSMLKSIDNKPLQIEGEFSEEKKTIEAEYKTGKKLPEIETFFPENSKSATIAVKFESPIKFDIKNTTPVPENIYEIDNWYIFSFSEPVDSLTIKKAEPSDRKVVLDDFIISLPESEPESKELSVSYESSDTTVSVQINDESAVAVKIDEMISVCNKKCSLEISGLKSSTEYNLSIQIFTTTGVKSKIAQITTESPAPHIIITEIMHTPDFDPEKNGEFVEIYNAGTLDFDLTGCFVDDKNDGTGKDPLLLKNTEDTLLLKSGELAVITGNEADFTNITGDFLWLTVDDTTIADAGLTSNESVQIICVKDEKAVIEDTVDPMQLKTDRGFSFNRDRSGKMCTCEESGGTPGSYYECP